MCEPGSLLVSHMISRAAPERLNKAMRHCADIEIQANEILHHKLTLNGYLAEFTGQSMERITQVHTASPWAYSLAFKMLFTKNLSVSAGACMQHAM